MAEVLSVIAILVSLATFFWTVASNAESRRAAAVSANTDLIIEIEGRVGRLPDLLRFHGINDPREELKKHGLTPEEFAYLVNSFTVGGTFYRNSPRPESILASGSYRSAMCLSPATQKAWPLVRVLIAPTAYRDALDNIFRDHGVNI